MDSGRFNLLVYVCFLFHVFYAAPFSCCLITEFNMKLLLVNMHHFISENPPRNEDLAYHEMGRPRKQGLHMFLTIQLDDD